MVCYEKNEREVKMMDVDRGFYNLIWAGSAALSTFTSIVSIVAYVLFSLGLMKLAENKGIANAWLAWIPIANLYLLGLVVEEVTIGTFKIDRMEIWLPVVCGVGAILMLIPVVRWVAMVALLVFMGFVSYRLFSMYRPEQAVLFTVLSVLLGLYWVFVFVIRNDQQVA